MNNRSVREGDNSRASESRASSLDSAEHSRECRYGIALDDVLNDIEVPSLEAPDLDASFVPSAQSKDLFAEKSSTKSLFKEKNRAAWKDVQQVEARCDFAPNKVRISYRSSTKSLGFAKNDKRISKFNIVLDHKATNKTLKLWAFITQVIERTYLADITARYCSFDQYLETQ